MEKVQVTMLIKGQEELKETLKGEFDLEKDKLVIHDLNKKQGMMMDFKGKKLTRQTEEFLMIIPFLKGKETTLTIELLETKEILELKMITEIYEYKERSLRVKYKIIESNEWIEYQMNF